MLFLWFRLAREFLREPHVAAENPQQAEGAGGGGGGAGNDGGEDAIMTDSEGQDQQAPLPQPPANQPAPAERACPLDHIVLVPVAYDAARAPDILRTNRECPGVCDYSEVAAFALYFVLKVPATEATVTALTRIVSDNRAALAMDAAAGGGGGGRGGHGGRGGRGGGGRGGGRRATWADSSPEALQASVMARSNAFVHAPESCLLHHDRGGRSKPTEDWALCFRKPRDFTNMFSTLTKYKATDVPTLAQVAELLTTNVESNMYLKFYKLPSTAGLPVRSLNGVFRFGVRDAGPGNALMAMTVNPDYMVHFQTLSKCKTILFPWLRPKGGDHNDNTRFGFLHMNTDTVGEGNKEGAIGRFKCHAEPLLGKAAWDHTALAPPGTPIVQLSEDRGDLLRPLLPACTSSPWFEDEDGSWRLRCKPDTAGYPDLLEPPVQYPFMRILCLTPLTSPSHTRDVEVVAVEMNLEAAHKPLSISLEVLGGVAVVAGDSLTDPREKNGGAQSHRKRGRDGALLPAALADLGGLSPGPMWPSRGDWQQTGTAGLWRPKTRLLHKLSGETFVILGLHIGLDASDDPSDGWDAAVFHEPASSSRGRDTAHLVLRAVDAVGSTVVQVAEGEDSAKVPMPADARAAFNRRLDVEFTATMRHMELLPHSYRDNIKWYDNYVSELRKSDSKVEPAFDYVHKDLTAGGNFYANHIMMFDQVMDVTLYHAIVFKLMLASRHVSKPTNYDEHKKLHQLLYGPAGVGKSFMMKIVKELAPRGRVVDAIHVSGQSRHADWQHVDEPTGTVEFRDEGDVHALGIETSSAGGARASSATTMRGVEFKQELTDLFLCSKTLVSDSRSGARTCKYFESRNETVHVQLMNNYPRLHEAMMSRFTMSGVYPFVRHDMGFVAARTSEPARLQYKARVCKSVAAQSFLQLKLETAQHAGILASVPKEGWIIFRSKLTTVIKEEFPFVLGGGLPLGRKLNDAAEYLCTTANAHAIHRCVAHPKAAFSDLAHVDDMEVLREAEKLLTPCDEMMYLAVSMLGDDFFPPPLIMVLRVVALMVKEQMVDTNGGPSEKPDSLAKYEWPLKLYAADLVDGLRVDYPADSDLGVPGGGCGCRMCSPEDDAWGRRGMNLDLQTAMDRIQRLSAASGTTEGAPWERVADCAPAWRSAAGQRQRMEGIARGGGGGGEDGIRKCTHLPLPQFQHADIAKAIKACQEAVVFTSDACKTRDSFVRHVAEAVSCVLNSPNETLPVDHITNAIHDLLHRSVVDHEAAGVACARTNLKVLSVEETPITLSNGAKGVSFSLVVAKAALDQLKCGQMDMVGLLRAVAHRYSKPGVVLVNAPLKVPGTQAFLPQLADFFTIDMHAHDCGIRERFAGGSADNNPGGMRKAFERQVEAVRAAAEPGSADARWPWASDAAVRGCTCFRKDVLRYSEGVPNPTGVSETMSRQLGGRKRARDAGLLGCTTRSVDMPTEEISFDNHVLRLTGMRYSQMTPEQRDAHPWLERAHPSTSYWHAPSATGGYPFRELAEYRNTAEAPRPGGRPLRKATWRAEKVSEFTEDRFARFSTE